MLSEKNIYRLIYKLQKSEKDDSKIINCYLSMIYTYNICRTLQPTTCDRVTDVCMAW